MSALPWPDHLITLDEWEALPEDNRFWVELVEGVLLVAPRPAIFHQRASIRLAYLVDAQLSANLSAVAQWRWSSRPVRQRPCESLT